MGGNSSKLPKQVDVLMLGLEGSGKTTLLYKLKCNQTMATVPTVGFNVEMLEVDRRGPRLTVWDVGGQKRMRPQWPQHCDDTAGLVFVVDSTDHRRLGEARRELRKVLSYEQLRGVPLVVLANKQDLPGALGAEALCEGLDLRRLCQGRAWFVQPCSATSAVGLLDGFKRMVYLMKTPLRQTQTDIMDDVTEMVCISILLDEGFCSNS